MVPDGRTDGMDGRMDGRTDDAKTISLRLRRGIITLYYHTTLLMMSHRYTQHTAPFYSQLKLFGLFLCLNYGVFDTIITATEFIDFF